MIKSTESEISKNSPILYDEDLQLWIKKTIDQLQNREFDALDLEHLIEELINLGKSEKNALKSNLKVLLAHFLKVKVQKDAPETMKSSWYNSINEHRDRVLDSLISTPSLKNYLNQAIQEVYLGAKKLAIKDSKNAKFGVTIPQENEYPQVCPYTVEQVFDEDFYGI